MQRTASATNCFRPGATPFLFSARSQEYNLHWATYRPAKNNSRHCWKQLGGSSRFTMTWKGAVRYASSTATDKRFLKDLFEDTSNLFSLARKRPAEVASLSDSTKATSIRCEAGDTFSAKPSSASKPKALLSMSSWQEGAVRLCIRVTRFWRTRNRR